jgi:hypothetical protein
MYWPPIFPDPEAETLIGADVFLALGTGLQPKSFTINTYRNARKC